MGTKTTINKSIDTFIIGTVEQVNWDEANVNWDTYYADEYYSKYLKSEFGVDIPGPPYEVLWDHAVLLTIGFPSSFDHQDQQTGEKKKRKQIKLIFMIDNIEKVFEKDKNNQIKVEFKNQVENQLSEQFGQQVILEDVQIIHR
jgi:hypothetical protein